MKKITLLFIIFTLLGCSTDNVSDEVSEESAPAPAVTLSADPTTDTTATTTTVGVSVSTPAPTVSLSADPTSITAGSSTTLSWTSSNADTVSIDNGIGTVATNGTSTVTPSATTTYTMTATGAGGTATDTVTVAVLPAAEPIITISAESESIALGSSTVLSWQSNNVDTVSIDNGIGPVALTGSQSVTPEHTTTYTVTGSGDKGTVSAQVTVQVTGSPEAQPEGSFGEQYDDLVPKDATVAKYDEKRFALITGVVNDMAGSPLADVRITVHGHPEYGTVLTDTEGRFSIPVEDGGTMTLAYRHDGFITSHRQVYVPWNDIAIAETVQMLTEDSTATKITFDGNP
ncbi:MAG: sugar-binding protein, partial [Candidatus Electrothrix sp. AUS3]|nr:sugar-binding protein [Candidatus Electrothrix gigas]